MLSFVIFGNTLLYWIFAIGILVLSFSLFKLLFSLLSRRIQKIANRTSNPIDDLLLQIIKNTKTFFLFLVGIYLGSQILTLEPQINKSLDILMIILLWIQAGFWATSAVRFWFIERTQQDENGREKTTLTVLNTIAKVVIWSIVLILALDNIPNVEINALIASLGIGGIVVGLALQKVLEDLFSSITIALDQPFSIGDFIKVDEFSGSVEKIGLKSTRLRSLSGEQLIFSNSDLLNSRLQNFKRMEQRRVTHKIGVTYDTSADKLKAIPKLIQDIVTAKELITFERANLTEFGDFSINFEFSYFVNTSDIQIHVDTQEKILIDLFEQFEQLGIEFAFPTQTIIMGKDN